MKFTTGSAPIPKAMRSDGRPRTAFRKALDDLSVGDEYVEVLLADTRYKNLTRVQAVVTNMSIEAFGRGNYVTRRNPDRTGIRIWRTA